MNEITINNWTLHQERAEQEPLVRDLDIAAKLGYSRPGSIRLLIKRLIDAGQLGEVCNTVLQTSTKGGRPSSAYYLSEAQALKVIARSETAIASKILDEVIAVYLAYRKGLLPSAPREEDTALTLIREQLAANTRALELLASTLKLLLSKEATAPQPLAFVEAPYSLPSPSKAAPLQRPLLREREPRWYLARELAAQWDLSVEELWRQYRLAGGTRAHYRQSTHGYQVREDVARKIQVQLQT